MSCNPDLFSYHHNQLHESYHEQPDGIIRTRSNASRSACTDTTERRREREKHTHKHRKQKKNHRFPYILFHFIHTCSKFTCALVVISPYTITNAVLALQSTERQNAKPNKKTRVYDQDNGEKNESHVLQATFDLGS